MRASRDHYETFERMHYMCFHYEFEHGSADADADPDEDCGVPGCPSAPAARHKDRLVATVRTVAADWSAGPPANWENRSLPAYLEAMAAWVASAGLDVDHVDHLKGGELTVTIWEGALGEARLKVVA